MVVTMRQFTWRKRRRLTPMPTTDDASTCDVLTGAPTSDEATTTAVDVPCAARPSSGWMP